MEGFKKNVFQHAAVKENVNITTEGAALQSQTPSVQENAKQEGGELD